MKTERELFEEWLKNTNKNLYDFSKDFIDDDSKESLCFQWAWAAWVASKNQERTKQHIHKFEEITVNGDDARKYICIYCGFEKSESFE